MAVRHWHLTYPSELVAEPVLWQLATDHGVVTNVRRADVREDVGWVIVEVRADDPTLDAARTWLVSLGVRVEELPDPEPHAG